jgi:hypothetical protein
MSDLSQTLVAAAAAAICPVASSQFDMEGSWTAEDWHHEASAAVAAVLETLAAHYFTHGGNHTTTHIEHLRKLAAEIKEGTA